MVNLDLEKNIQSKKLFERAKQALPGGVNSPVRAFAPNPFFVTHANGSKIFDVDNQEYIDYCMAYGALFLGHSHPQVLKSVQDQLVKGTLYGTPTEIEVKLAEKIKTIFPSIDLLRLVSTGTEATMGAIRVARGYTNRNKVVKFEGCFHGSHDAVLVKAGSGATTFGAPSSLGVPPEITQNTTVLPYNDVQSFEELIKCEANQIACVIVEPIMGNAGLILPKKGYLEFLRKITQDYGIVLIFDEIITGFRLALGGAQEYFGITPDLTTLGKVLGGGFAIAAFGGKKEIMQNISPSGKVYQAGTFSANPISTTAANTTIDILTQNKKTIYPKLEKNCTELSDALKAFSEKYKLDSQVYNIASMFQIFFSKKPITDMVSAKFADTKKFTVYFNELLKQGIFIPPAQFETCFLSDAHLSLDIEKTIEAFDKALQLASKIGSD